VQLLEEPTRTVRHQTRSTGVQWPAQAEYSGLAERHHVPGQLRFTMNPRDRAVDFHDYSAIGLSDSYLRAVLERELDRM
jgi:hypothetical protein